MHKKISMRDYNGVFICHELHTFHKEVYSIYDTKILVYRNDMFGIYINYWLIFLKLIFIIFIEMNMNEKQFFRKDKDWNIYQNYIWNSERREWLCMRNGEKILFLYTTSYINIQSSQWLSRQLSLHRGILISLNSERLLNSEF